MGYSLVALLITPLELPMNLQAGVGCRARVYGFARVESLRIEGLGLAALGCKGSGLHGGCCRYMVAYIRIINM